MASNEELACVYSALILQDADSSVTTDNLQKLLRSVNVDVESFWPGLFAKAVSSINLKDLVSNVGAVDPRSGRGASDATDPVVSQEKKETKKQEEPEEEDEDMGFGLFD